MSRTNFFVALAVGVSLAAGASASAQGFRHYHRYGYGPRFGFGVGLTFVEPRPHVYRNPFTADVSYAERTSNDFRAAYEHRGGDPFGVKGDVQRLDEDMERLRAEAEYAGGVTIRGTELLRDALDRADRIDRAFRREDDQLASRWDRFRRLLDDLARTYRA